MFEKDKKFKEAIGAFIIAFSELEFGLAYLGALTEQDLRKKDLRLINHIGFNFTTKVKNLTDFINQDLVEFKDIWKEIKENIEHLNKQRRFIAHGFRKYYLPKETISTFIKDGKIIVKKELDIDTINNLTKKLHEINTGKNGINGEFHQLFTLARINKWNELVNDNNKIVYKVNNNIITDWKGK